jgi:hypothetical protein
MSITKEDPTNFVSSPWYREEIDYGGVELAVGKLQMDSSHPHRQSKLERGNISQKLFGQLDKLQVNNLTRVSWRWNLGLLWKSEIRNVGECRLKTPNSAQAAYQCTEGYVLGLFHPHQNCWYRHVTAEIDIWSTFLRGHHSGRLKKKLTQIPDPNSEKGQPLHLDNTRPYLADHEIQSNNPIRLSHPSYSQDSVPTDF